MSSAEPGAAGARPRTPLDTSDLVGLALSGGGIRSATFALGALQALHRLGLLRFFDYLSTVSGGGFTGGWLSAWLAREPRGPGAGPFGADAPFPEPEAIDPDRHPRKLLADGDAPEAEPAPGPDPTHWLRLFSNYLTPRRGALSADTWRAVTFYARSMVFNWLVLLPFLLGVIMLGQLWFMVRIDGASASAFVCSTPGDAGLPARTEPDSLCGAEPPATHSAIVAARLRHAAGPLTVLGAAVSVLALLWLIHGAANPWLAFAGVLLVGTSVAFPIYMSAGPLGPWSSTPALAGLGAALAALAHLGNLLVARRPISADALRTRLTQWTSLLLLGGSVIGVWLAVAGFGHEAFWFFFDPGYGAISALVRASGGYAAVLAAAASAAYTAYQFAPSSRVADSGEPQHAGARLAFALAPYLVLAVLLVLFAAAGRSAVAALARMPELRKALFYGLISGSVVQTFLAISELSRRTVPGRANRRAFFLFLLALLGGIGAWWLRDPAAPTTARELPYLAFGLILVLIAVVVAVGWLSDPNMLSLHAFYKARLVRAYLGASNPGRAGTRVTDPAPGDDVLLRDLCSVDEGAPYHLINTTLNLVASRDLATAQRSAASFVLSRAVCGSARTGFRRTESYMGGKLTLGTALAISGAAASPNMGSQTPGLPMVLLLALLNARLGFWAPTPRAARWKEPRAALWPYYVLREALSQTTDLSTYCYLSDGGHFDNTGLYALVERGCRYLLLLDCGADPKLCFADVGQAIRRCRIDFGAEIALDVQRFLDPPAGLAGAQLVVGSIQYRREHFASLGLPCADEADRSGIIAWLKPAVTAKDAADVRQYRLQNPSFPQQTTLDQWYDEAQFESYRKLGYDSVMHALAACAPRPGPPSADAVEELFRKLQKS